MFDCSNNSQMRQIGHFAYSKMASDLRRYRFVIRKMASDLRHDTIGVEFNPNRTKQTERAGRAEPTQTRRPGRQNRTKASKVAVVPIPNRLKMADFGLFV